MTRNLSGRGVLLCLIGFFAVVIAVNAYFIFVSVDTFRGEDEQKPYLQGVEYNQTLARRAAQRSLGWRAAVSASRLASGEVRVAVALTRPDGTPQPGVKLQGELRHPADENRDRSLKLREVSPGSYQAYLSGIHPGRWDILIQTARNDVPFEASRRLWVP